MKIYRNIAVLTALAICSAFTPCFSASAEEGEPLTDTIFTVDPDNPAYSSLDGILYNKDRTVLYRYPAAREQDTFCTPDSVRFVDGAAFAYTTGVETEQLDVYYARTQEELAQIAGYSAFTQSGYTIHADTTEDDLVSADLSGDGIVDAQDAAHLLSYAAKCGTDFNGGLMLYQHSFTDGLVLAAGQQGDAAVPATLAVGSAADALDAAVILQYAAAVDSGYEDGLSAFLRNQ